MSVADGEIVTAPYSPEQKAAISKYKDPEISGALNGALRAGTEPDYAKVTSGDGSAGQRLHCRARFRDAPS